MKNIIILMVITIAFASVCFFITTTKKLGESFGAIHMKEEKQVKSK